MVKPLSAPIPLARMRLGVTGLVQGVGFRPFVYRLAQSHNLAGWVRNTSRGVEIEVEGPPATLDLFIRQLSQEAPALARVEGVISEETDPLAQETFEILESESLPGTDDLEIIVDDIEVSFLCIVIYTGDLTIPFKDVSACGDVNHIGPAACSTIAVDIDI